MTAESDIYTVSDVTTGIKALLEDTFPRISISGEISNFKHHTSGHMYFSLKDTRSQLRCVMWRSSTKGLTFQPEDGMEVVAQGALTVYENQGQYQLVAKRLKPVGAGALQAAFEQLKTRLAEEGLFDEGNKQPLPAYPDCVGVVTSATGAAVRDIIQVLHRRAPWVTIILRSVPVQGEGAANEIATAIDEMNIFGGVDVLIVGRGGGSMEDLWAFNEEPVVRAIYKSNIPIISAVGHEVDFTLSDFAADLRAPTPSGAAELVVRDRQELLGRVAGAFTRTHSALTTGVTRRRQQLESILSSYGFRQPLNSIRQYAQQIDDLSHRMTDQYKHLHENRTQRLGSLAGQLQALSPLAVLGRGYAVCRTPDGQIIQDAGRLKIGDRMDVHFHKGEVICRVEHTRKKTAPSSTPRDKKKIEKDKDVVRLNLFDD